MWPGETTVKQHTGMNLPKKQSGRGGHKDDAPRC